MHIRRASAIALGFAVTVLIGFVGCEKAATPPATDKNADKKVPISTPSDKALTPADVSAGPGKEKPPAETASTTAATGKKQKVKLMDPSLTAGIPGSDPLTIDDIKKWLDDPKNHEELEVELPMGLAAGQNDIKGLKDNPLTRAKIELGRQLYFDTRLSKDNTVSCASCHSPDTGFAAPTQFGVGVDKQEGNRNSPVSYNRILSDLQFWDGREPSLEGQAKGPIANPIEMANTHEEATSTIKNVEGYELQFQRIFGQLNIHTVAQAVASFERAIVTGPTPFDYNEQMRAFAGSDPEDLKTDDPELYQTYLKTKSDADAHPMSDSAKRGRDLFFGEKGSCTACHVGPNLTDEKYHNLGVGMNAAEPDLGRYVITKTESEKGAFKTPTIRNVAQSAPYMHDGSVKTLAEVLELYAKGGEPNQWLDPKVKKLELSEQDKKDLVAFMEACTGDFPVIERGRMPQ